MSTSDGEKQITRLGLILARLASPFDGERAAAALLASRELETLGVSWAEFARRAFPPAVSKPAQAPPRRSEQELRADLIDVLLDGSALSDWERDFLTSIKWRDDLTEKQQACFDKIARKHR